MELRQLEYFRMIVETGSISEAARRLHMSQPPLSYQMKKLEEEVGTILFARGHRNITLTEAGTILYTRALQILSMSDAAVHEAGRAGKFRTLYVGMTPSTIRIMGRYLKEFSILHPEVRYQIRDGSTFLLKHLLESGEIDVAVLRTPVPTDTMEVQRLGTDPMAAAVPAGLLKTLLPCISLKELAALPLSVYQRYVDLLTECFARENLTPDFFSVCDDARTSLLWAEEGIAAAVFPESLLGRASFHLNFHLKDLPGLYSLSNSLNHVGEGDGEGSSCRVFRISEPALQTDVLLVRDKSRTPNAIVDELWTFVEGRRQALHECRQE